MSIKRIDSISPNILNLILYVSSPSLEYYIKNTLKERFAMHKDFVVDVATAKALQNAKVDSYVAPFFCEKWLIHVDTDKFTKKELASALANNTIHGITVYWTSKFMNFKQMQDLDIVKQQGVHCPTFSFSRLGYNEITHLHNKMCGSKYKLEQKLLDHVCKTYTYDVQAVCDLFTLIRSGNEITTKRDIIEAVGVGGNSVSSLTVKILTAGNPSNHPMAAMAGKAKKKAPKKNKDGSERKKKIPLSPAEALIQKRKNSLSATLKLIDDLSVSTKYDTIMNFMLNNVEGFIEMKQLQIMGLYNRVNREIPDTFNTKRLSMLRRFERVILNEVTLPTLLNLKMCLLRYRSFNSEIALVQAISEFYQNVSYSKPN
jgi:hypothetical protein